MQISTGPIGTHKKGVPFHIYGAGIAGLVMAYYLKKYGHQVVLYELSSKTGGKIGTVKSEHGLAEQAANAVFTNADVMELIQELNIDYIGANKKLKRKIWRGSLKNLKMISIYEILLILFRVFKKTPQITEEMSVKEFFLPLLGNKVCDEVLSSALSGIYATTSDQLHFLSIFKIEKSFKGNYLQFFKELKKKRAQKHKATSISFKNGMQDLIDKLTSELSGNINLNASPAIDEYINNVICTSAPDAAQLVQAQYPELSKELNKIDYLPLSTSTYILNTEIEALKDSFGILFPRQFEFKTMGILNNTAIFNRGVDKNYYSYTFITPQADDLQTLHTKEMYDLTKKDLFYNIKFSSHKVWKEGIPFYNYQRYKTVKALRTKIYNYNPGIIFFGNYVDGISIREMISHAKNFAKNI